MQWCGLDFGTSNTSIAVLGEDGHPCVLPIGNSSRHNNSSVLRSVLYIDREHHVYLGTEGIETFIEQNARRLITKKPVRIGAYIADVDLDIPGRLFQSLKAFLASPTLKPTDVFGKKLTIEQLIAILLHGAKSRAEQLIGESLDSVVLGRPAVFSLSRAMDALAEQRLRSAARLAGFCQVAFELEPVAACLHHASKFGEPRSLLTFDFGGGTLDICVVYCNGPTQFEVLAQCGLQLGGDDFDAAIMERHLLKYFGGNAVWSGQELPVPSHYMDALLHWDRVHALNTPRELDNLRGMHNESNYKDELLALETLITHNYIWELYEVIRYNKCAVSTAESSCISFHRRGITIEEPFTRNHMNQIVNSYRSQIEELIDIALGQARLDASDIHTVVCTGGSSLIPSVQALLSRRFTKSRLVTEEPFTSVAAGLALTTRMQVTRATSLY